MQRPAVIHHSIALVVCIFATGCSGNPTELRQKYLASGDKYFAEAKYAEAAIEYRNAVHYDKKSGEAHLKLAESYARVDQPAKAFREYIRAADLLPEDVDVQLKAGAALLLAGKYDEAKARAEGVLKRGQNVRALLLLGNAMAGLKDVDGAIAEVEEAISLDPVGIQPYTNLGALQLARGDRAAAERTFRKAVEIAGHDVSARLALGNFFWSTGRMAEAEEQFRKAWTLNDKDLRAARAMTLVLIASNRLREAQPYLERVAELAPGARTKLALSDYYVVLGQKEKAITVLQSLSETVAVATDARARLSAIDYMSGRKEQAHARLDELLASDGVNLRARLLKARLLEEDGLHDAALEVARKAAEKHADAPAARYVLGLLLEARGESGAAQTEYRAVLELNPRAVPAQLRLSNLALAAGARDQAVQYAAQAVKGQPSSPDAHLALARALLARGEYAAAERELAGFAERFPNAPQVQVVIGTLHSKKGNSTEARKAFERALTADAGAAEALAGLIALDAGQGNLAAARLRLQKQLDAKPDHPGLMMVAARLYALDRDWPRSEATLRRVIELDPQNLSAYATLGQLYIAQGKVDAARQEFETVAHKNPNSVAAPTMIATILHQQNRLADTLPWYERALKADPNAAVAANNLAWLYAEGHGGNLDLALKLAQTAAEQLPDNAEISDTLGWVYYRKGLAALAIAPLARSVELSPQNPMYHYHLGLAYAQEGRRDRARKALERALSLQSNFAGADDARKLLGTL